MTDANDATLPTSTAPTPFDWRRFAVHLGTFMLVVLLIGIAVAVVLGRKPLTKTVTTAVAAHGISLEIQWPMMNVAANADAAKSIKAAKPKPSGKPSGNQEPAISKTAMTQAAPTAAPMRSWLPEQFQDELLTLGMRALGNAPDPLSREPLDRLGAAMADSGWFAGVPMIERQESGRIVVHGSWRVPAAVVRINDKDQLLSWDGKPMPVAYEPSLSGLRVISGAAEGPGRKADGSTDYSLAWPGEDVSAAVELLALLTQQPYAAQIAGIDVSMYAGKKWLIIDTTMGTRIVWGGRASKPLNGECATNFKLAKLEKLRREVGRIDAGVGAIEIWWPIDRPLQIDLTATAARAAEEALAREMAEKTAKKSSPLVQHAKPATPTKPGR